MCITYPYFPFRQTAVDPYHFRVHTYCAAGYLLRTELHPFNKDATCNIGVQTKLHSTLHSIFYFLSKHVASIISTQYLLFNISNQHPDPFNFHPAYWRHAPYYHLHNIRKIRKFLSQEATCTIINAFIASQIDYCNSLMNGLPENLIKKLQRVQNTAARLVFNLRKYEHITPALVTLHWLPVKYRIEFKTLLIVFKGLHGKAPTYIQEMTIPSKSKRYSIRSNEERVLKVPKFKHDTFGKRTFAVYGSLAWNCVPKEIRLCAEIEAFKRNLKTLLFVKFVNESTFAIWFWRIIVNRPRMLSAQFVAQYKPCKPKT